MSELPQEVIDIAKSIWTNNDFPLKHKISFERYLDIVKRAMSRTGTKIPNESEADKQKLRNAIREALDLDEQERAASTPAFDAVHGRMGEYESLSDPSYKDIQQDFKELVERSVKEALKDKKVIDLIKSMKEGDSMVNPRPYTKSKENKNDDPSVLAIARRNKWIKEHGDQRRVVFSKHPSEGSKTVSGSELDRQINTMPKRSPTLEAFKNAELESYARKLLTKPDPISDGEWMRGSAMGLDMKSIAESRRKLGKA